MPTAIEFNNISKLYRLGQVSSETLTEDLNRWWTMKIRRKEDPLAKIGRVNDIAAKGGSDYVWALKDVSFKVEQGDVVGIIGNNGAGKSTLLKIVSKITTPTIGTVKANGRVGSLLEVGTGFHNEMTGRENIFLNGAILGMSKADIARRFDEIVDFSGCERFIDTPVKRYSSGMRMRLGFAVAANLDPEILLVDEVLAVGDMQFRQKAITKMLEMSQTDGRTVIFVSHNMVSIKKLCNTGILLKNGEIDYIGKIDGAIGRYLNYGDVEDTETDIPLGIDRKGNGAIRLNNIRILDKDGEERSTFGVGEECVIKVGYDLTERLEKCRSSSISVGINIPDGRRMAWMGTSVFSKRLDETSGTVCFRIPKLMLTPGKYSVVLIAKIDGKEADFVRQTAQIELRYNDYFGTGTHPPKDNAAVGYALLDYAIEWE